MSRKSDCGNWKTLRGVVVDNRSCDSIGGCCDSRRRCLCCTHSLTTLASSRSSAWPMIRQCQQCARHGQELPQAVARAWNHTCIELSSVQSTRTRFEPLSAVRGHIDHVQLQPEPSGRHIVDLHALKEFCF
eukprot:scaffold21511_cov133-Isochrysis_galbana.AAC.4